jgi:hypothetical protein
LATSTSSRLVVAPAAQENISQPIIFIFSRKIFSVARHIIMRTGKALSTCEKTLKMPTSLFSAQPEKKCYNSRQI